MYPNDNSLAFKNSKGLRWGEKSEKEKKQMEKQTNRLSYDKEVTKTKKKNTDRQWFRERVRVALFRSFCLVSFEFFLNKSPVC